jgi:hypothetical protein
MPEGVKRNGSIGRAVCAAVTMLAVPAGECGPPFQTDDPNIVERKRAEALSYYQSTLTESGRSGTLPGLELHYGAFERTELDLILPYAFHSSPGSSTAHGYGDTVVGIKYALIPETDGFLLSAVPKVSFPRGNASRGLGNGGSAIFLALAVQETSGDFTTYGNAGYWINNGAGNRDYVFIGGVAQWRFSERWTLGAEMFYSGPPVEGQRASVGFNVGGLFAVGPGSQILFSAGRGLVNAAESNRVSAYLGVQFGF